MSSSDLSTLQRLIAAQRAEYLTRLAAEDPSLDQLAAALAEERRCAQLNAQEMQAFVQNLEARMGHDRKDAS